MTKRSKHNIKDIFERKAEKEVEKHIMEKPWIKNFLDKHIWYYHRAAYPSVVGHVIGEQLKGNKIKSWQRKSNWQKIIYINESQIKDVDFLERYKRINIHIGNKENHSQVLEFLFGLALIVVKNEMMDIHPFEIAAQKVKDGGRPDYSISIPSIATINIDMKNRFSNFSEDNAKDIIEKYSGINTYPMVVHPFLSVEAQEKLIEANGFFCNIGRIYTGYYDGIEEDLKIEGISKGVVILRDDITTIYEKLKDAINENNTEEFEKIAEYVFKYDELNYFLRKIRGILRFAILKIKFNLYENLYDDLRKLKIIKLKGSKEDILVLRMTPLVYFIFLFQPYKQLNIQKIISHLLKYSELAHLKKLNKERREKLVKKSLQYLVKIKFINKVSRNAWMADDVESPYPSPRDIMKNLTIIEGFL